MTGPEHYQRAEAILSFALARMDDDYRAGLQDGSLALSVAHAQAHATLALAAATALSDIDGALTVASDDAWLKAAGKPGAR